MWNARFEDLALRFGAVSGEPLDWTPEPLPDTIPQISASSEMLDDADDALDKMEKTQPEVEKFESSYWGMDLDCWDFVQEERDLDLTMPLEYKGASDNLISEITEVHKNFGK